MKSRWERIQRYVSIGSILFALSVLGVLIYSRANVYAPLEHPVPENITRDPAIFQIGETRTGAVVSRSLFFNSDELPLVSSVSARWVLIDPRNTSGFSDTPAQLVFVTSFDPGCTVGEFKDILPDDAIEITQRLFNDGYEAVTWRLEGTNTITQPRLAEDAIPFYTENVTLIPDDAPLPDSITENVPSCP